jgi:folate-dependent phosphoribosylglycinamide formyltransferase PurN
VLFRAGLIVGPAVLSTGVPVMNIHCARIPEYGGIGSIDRALRDGAYSQCATLHQVTTRIDEGEVHATEPYQLDPADGYCSNEDRAYDAGIRLLKRVLA